MVIFLLKLSEFSTQVQYFMTLYPLQPYHKGLFILKSLKEREKKKKVLYLLERTTKEVHTTNTTSAATLSVLREEHECL